MRGRLIWPFLLEVHRLDYAAMRADPDAGGPETSGLDPIFKEPIRLPSGEVARKELPPILVPCQPENQLYDQLQMVAAGNDPTSRFIFTFHFQDLEQMDLVDPATGNALIRTGDRASAIYKQDGTFIQKLTARSGKGFYCTEAQPASFGLSGGERNLLLCTFEPRDQSYRGGG